MKQFRLAALALVITTGMYSSVLAGDLTSIRVSNYDGTSRVVLDMTELPLSWTKSYNEDAYTVTINLGNTTNRVTDSVEQKTKHLGVLKGIKLLPNKTNLQIQLNASQNVNYHAFTLQKPNRIVIDLFSDYTQRTTKNVSDSIQTTKVKTNVSEGLVEASAMTIDNDSPMVVVDGESTTLQDISEKHVAAIGLVQGRKTVTTSTANNTDKKVTNSRQKGANGAASSTSTSQLSGTASISDKTKGILRYTPSRGYFIEPKQLARVETSGGASYEGGTLILHDGKYVGPEHSYNLARTLIGTTKDEQLIVATIDKKGHQSVGVTLEEGAEFLTSLGAVNGFELPSQKSVDMTIQKGYVHKAGEEPEQYTQYLIIK